MASLVTKLTTKYSVAILFINTITNNSYYLGMSVQVDLFIGLVKLTLANQ